MLSHAKMSDVCGYKLDYGMQRFLSSMEAQALDCTTLKVQFI
jgi:hypothetical protein